MVGELGIALFDLAEDQAAWSQATFGADSQRDGVGALKHLAKEALEAEAAAIGVRYLESSGVEPQETRAGLYEELADCLLLVLDASRRSGLSPLRLLRAAQAKMIVNKGRKWPTPQTDTPVEHVRDAG